MRRVLFLLLVIFYSVALVLIGVGNNRVTLVVGDPSVHVENIQNAEFLDQNQNSGQQQHIENENENENDVTGSESGTNRRVVEDDEDISKHSQAINAVVIEGGLEPESIQKGDLTHDNSDSDSDSTEPEYVECEADSIEPEPDSSDKGGEPDSDTIKLPTEETQMETTEAFEIEKVGEKNPSIEEKEEQILDEADATDAVLVEVVEKNEVEEEEDETAMKQLDELEREMHSVFALAKTQPFQAGTLLQELLDATSTFLDSKVRAVRKRNKVLRGSMATMVAIAMEFGQLGYDIDVANSVRMYKEGANMGNSTAQFRMGALHASGALGVKQDPTQALLYYYFSSLAGNPLAHTALGYRHMFGLGVPKSCETAVRYYELAANAAVEQIELEGIESVKDYERLGLGTAGFSRYSQGGNDEDLVDYYKHSADKGDSNSQFTLGQYYYYGVRGVDRDLEIAANYFSEAARSGDPSAQTSLANMLVRGHGIKQDLKAAFANFTAAAKAGGVGGMNGLGYLYLYGLGVNQDTEIAVNWFNQAAEQGNAEAYYNLGALYITGIGVNHREYQKALKFFTLATKKGHVLAMHKLALMNLQGIGKKPSCESALPIFKLVSERAQNQVNIIGLAKALHHQGNLEGALQQYLIGAELGCEVAQNNAAWLLDNGVSIDGGVRILDENSEEFFSKTEKVLEDVEEELSWNFRTTVASLLGPWVNDFGRVTGSNDAMRLLYLAAEQGNVEARVKIGDYYYYSIGGVAEPDFKQAAYHYKKATEHMNTQAMFNLGYMHEHGIGLPQDFHLAKRYYDKADETSAEAHVPVSLALAELWIHRVYRAIRYGDTLSGFPTFATPLIEWLRGIKVYYFAELEPNKYNTEAADAESRKSKDPIPTTPPTLDKNPTQNLQGAGPTTETPTKTSPGHGGSASEQTSFDIYDMFLSDTLIALWLSVLLAVVVYYRHYRLLEHD